MYHNYTAGLSGKMYFAFSRSHLYATVSILTSILDCVCADWDQKLKENILK